MSEKRGQIVDIFIEDNSYQHLEVLKRNREKRQRYHEIFVEGVSSINALIQTGHPITSVAYSREKELSDWAKSVIRAADPHRIYRLSAELMQKLSDRSDPSELIVTAQPIQHSLDDIALTSNMFVVIFERPSNHGNLGSLIRSCDAFGVDAIIITGHSIDPYDPTVIRASLGAIFHSHIIRSASATALEHWIDQVRQVVPDIQFIGTRAEAPHSAFEISMTPPLILVLGNEAQGMSRRLEELVDFSVSIPMNGHVDSLNVACAGSILLYQVKMHDWKEGHE